MIISFNKFLYMQCHFSKDICDEIFGDMSDHIYQKWLDSNMNIVEFLSRLDSGKKRKMFLWVGEL